MHTKLPTRVFGKSKKKPSKNSRATSRKSSGNSATAASRQKSAVNWTTKQLSRNVFEVAVPLKPNKDWEAWCFLVSDQHWDNPKCDQRLLRKHYEQMVERNAMAISVGDQLCMMQGKYDKRASKSECRPEHRVDNYLDAVINTFCDFHAPYANNFVMLGMGNHEASIADRHETNVNERIIAILNSQTGSNIFNGGYSGYVRFRFTNGDNGFSSKFVVYYEHGFGSGSGSAQQTKRAVYFPDSELVISGHNHNAVHDEFCRSRLTPDGKIRNDVQTHIKLGTYKDDRGDGFGGFAATTGHPPRSLGGWWLRFYYDRPSQRVLYEVIRAK